MQAPANLSDERTGTVVQCRRGFEREGTAARGLRRSATARPSQPYPDDPPEGASDADCIVIIGTA